MIRQARFHRGSNAQTRMNTAKIVIREVQGDSGFQVIQLLAESVCQPRQSANLHPQREVLPFHQTGRDVLRVRTTPSNLGYNLHDWPWGVPRSAVMLAIIAKQLFQLREIGVSSEAFSNSCGVERIGVCGELNAVSHSLSQIPDERLRVQHCAPPNDVAGNEFRFLIQSGKNPSISELARVILLHVASLLADESPYLIDLQITTGHFLHSFIEQRLGLLSGDKKQSHNHIPVQSSEPFGRADRAALKQTLNGLHPQFGVGCHGLPR